MSFTGTLEKIDPNRLIHSINNASTKDVAGILKKRRHNIEDFPILVSPAAEDFLEQMANRAKHTTLLRFGKTVKMYAPLYISNECTNACVYCGFNAENKIKRTTLTLEQVCKEADSLYDQGFRHILLVSGEDKKKVPVAFIADIAKALSKKFVGISIEVYPMDTEDYKKLAQNGVTGIAVYQETYNRSLYKTLHKGPKADFDYRLQTCERAGVVGFREFGIGALLGLSDFRMDMTCVALHAGYLMKKFWKSQLSISFPRLRDAAGDYTPPINVSDRQLAQVIFALRIVLPDADLVLSTREEPSFRNGMAGIGITRMSAGSKTQPGGYLVSKDALEQFEVADTRTPAEVAEMLTKKGFEPVWKDFDMSFLFAATN